MTSAVRSFAKLHTVQCLHCDQPFEQLGQRGPLRRTCSDRCRDERYRVQRTDVRRDRYRTLVKAGAFPALAQMGSQGPRAFEGAMKALAECDPAPLGLTRPERHKPVGRLRDLVRAATPATPKAKHPWRERRRSAVKSADGAKPPRTPAQVAATHVTGEMLQHKLRWRREDA